MRSAGGSSPRPSSAGTGGVGIDELLRQLKQLFRPDQEDMGTFLARVTRLVMALKSLGYEASAQDLAMVTLKAEIMQESYDEVGAWDVRGLVRNLRDKFALVALDADLSNEEKTAKSEVIGQAILALGGKESSHSDKLFSTPSADAASGRRRGLHSSLRRRGMQCRLEKLDVLAWRGMQQAEETRRCALRLQLLRWSWKP